MAGPATARQPAGPLSGTTAAAEQIGPCRAPTVVPPAAGAPRRARRTGRPPKLTQQRGDMILADLEAGLSRRAGGRGGGGHRGTRRAGIHEDTLRRWLRRGAAQDLGMYADFCGAPKKAEAEFMFVALQAITAG